MLIIDKDGEEFIRESHFDIAVPVHVELFEGEVKIFAYPFARQLCEEYEQRFKNDLFSDDALEFIREGCIDFKDSVLYGYFYYHMNTETEYFFNPNSDTYYCIK